MRQIILLISLIAAFATPLVLAQSEIPIDQRLQNIEQLLQNQGLLNMLQQLRSLERELNQLRGETELQNHNMEQLQKRQRTLYTDLDQRMQELERPPAAATQSDQILLPEPDGSTPPLQTLSPIYDSDPSYTNQSDNPLSVEIINSKPIAIAQQQPTPTKTLEQSQVIPQTEIVASVAETNQEIEVVVEADPAKILADYQSAFNLLKQQKYDQAIASFRNFLTSYPNANYSDNAQYWLAEAYYVNRQFETAVSEYETLANNYPQSQKYTHALLKIGYSYHELGLFSKAKTFLQDLTSNYPGTTAGRLAEDRLKTIQLAEQQKSKQN